MQKPFSAQDLLRKVKQVLRLANNLNHRFPHHKLTLSCFDHLMGGCRLKVLKCSCDLAETESFTKAAQINNVTQSAVSQQISSLERQFKSLLIERSKKKFRLTREGQVLYEVQQTNQPNL